MKTISNYVGGRTHFSLSQSIISPKDLVSDVATYDQYESMVVTDYNSINALVQAYTAAKDKEITMHVGASVRVVDDITWRRAKRGEAKKKPNPFFMPKLIIKNDAGLKDLIGLLTLANDADHFYFEPQVELQELLDVVERGNLIMTTGDIFSLFSHKNYEHLLTLITDSVDASNLACELVPVATAYYERVNDLIALTIAQRDDLKAIVSRPILYREGGSKVRDTMYCIMNRNTVDELWGWKPDVDNLHALNPTDMNKAVERMHEALVLRGHDTVDAACLIESAIDATNTMFKECSYEWHKLDVCLPHMSENSFVELATLAKEGWKNRFHTPTLGYVPPEEKIPEYKERLKYELGVLKKMGFEDYFLLVRKIVNWSKETGIEVGPARGCFTKGQLVLMADGSKKEIQDIEVGEEVVSHDLSVNTVSDTLIYDCNEEIVTLEFEDGRIITCTKDHEIFTSNRGWVAADELTEEDDVIDVEPKNLR